MDLNSDPGLWLQRAHLWPLHDSVSLHHVDALYTRLLGLHKWWREPGFKSKSDSKAHALIYYRGE